MEGVMPRRVIAQPVEDREAMAGWMQSPPYNSPHPGVSVTVPVEEADISIRKAVHNEQLSFEEETRLQRTASFASSRSVSTDEAGMVVNMRQQLKINDNIRIRQPGVSEQDLSINVRKVEQTQTRCHAVDETTDLDFLEEVEEPLKKETPDVPTSVCGMLVYKPTTSTVTMSVSSDRGARYVTIGDDKDILALMQQKPEKKGVICNSKVLHSEMGFYQEGQQYTIIPGTQSKGAYGEAAMCQDLKTGKMFMLKRVRGKLAENEVKVPLMFKGNVGIPEVYGMCIKNQETEIFQEFAGLSIKKLIESEYAEKLRDPKMVLLFAFQAFATLHKLHSQGVTHQDIKPENLCIDVQEKNWRLKFIDFGSSQTPYDHITEGLTNEYLSPESCRTILQVATGKLPREKGRLGPENDVWALALSLLYCLCGYHVMVYVCTGDTMYRDTDPKKLEEKRIQALFRICNLKDQDVVSKLIHSSWPDALKILLLHTLKVNPKERWTAEQAASFILSQLMPPKGSVTQPEQKPVAAAPSSSGFTLAPARLVVRPSAVNNQTEQTCQNTEAAEESSPASSAPSTPSTMSSPSSAQLPAFMDLLSDDLSKKAPRPYKRKQRDGPYPQPAGRGFKTIKK